MDDILSTFGFLDKRKMVGIIEENILINYEYNENILTDVQLIHTETGKNYIHFVNKETGESTFNFELNYSIKSIVEDNSIENISAIVKRNSNVLLDDIITLLESYRKFDYIIENEQRVVEKSSDEEKISHPLNTYMYATEYYSSGRIKSYKDGKEFVNENYEDTVIDFGKIENMYIEVENIVNNTIKNNEYPDHIYQLGESLIPYISGYYMSKNLTKDEQEKLDNIKNKTMNLSKKYDNYATEYFNKNK